jgi:hypothetical protein
MVHKGQRWREGAYVCAALHDPVPSITCDGWTSGGERLEIKCTGSVTEGNRSQVFLCLNLTNYDRFIGLQVEPWVAESIDWEAWIVHALGGPVPTGFDDAAVIWQQYQQPLMDRLNLRSRAQRTVDWRGMEVLSRFPCHYAADEPCLVDPDVLEFV